jgi:hypothetical protein
MNLCLARLGRGGSLWRSLATVALLLLGPIARPGLAADEPPARDAAPSKPAKRAPEFTEMLASILVKGADMGPGEAWFHPARSRYDWAWLAARDKDGDGAVTRDELGAPADLFGRLDRDRDGAVTKEDLDWSPSSAYLRGRSMARPRFSMMDENSNGRVTRKEWEALFDRIAKGKKYLTPDDLADALYAPPPRPKKDEGPPPDMPSRKTLLVALFRGELGSAHEGPDVGRMAPEFTLKTHDGKRTISLSEFRGRKPVVLVFGSFT